MKRRYFYLIILFAFMTRACSVHILKDSIDHSHRKDFQKLFRSNQDHNHKVIFAIKQNGIDKLEDILYDVSTVESANYGKHKSFEEVGEIIQNEIGTRSVVDWLKLNHVTIQSVTAYGEYVTCVAKIEVWEKLLRTMFYTYKNWDDRPNSLVTSDEDNVHRATSYSLPDDIIDHVHSIINVIDLPPRTTVKGKIESIDLPETPEHASSYQRDIDLLATATIRRFPSSFATPSTLQSMYNIDRFPTTGLGSQGVYETLSQTFLPSDISAFQYNFGITDDPVDNFIGPFPNNSVCSVSLSSCSEATMDIQYMLALGRGIPITYHYDDSGDGSFYSFLIALSNLANPSKVYSISYGANEIDINQNTLILFNIEAMKLGIRGVTLVASAGDDGVAGNMFAGDKPMSECGYYAQWPASSPYVTAVGGTMFGSVFTGTAEVVCTSSNGAFITTGGGFSNSIPAPSYQQKAINSYLAQYAPASSAYMQFNSSNRGYPDVSMAAYRYGKTFILTLNC